jgi:hypothetical protein
MQWEFFAGALCEAVSRHGFAFPLFSRFEPLLLPLQWRIGEGVSQRHGSHFASNKSVYRSLSPILGWRDL